MGHPGIPTKICILLTLFSVISSLTPPTILYGGWTPILPGHPFHFGPVRRRYHEQSRHQQQYDDEHTTLPYPQQTPYHQVEHHFEQHIELVEPKQHHRPPAVYSSSQIDKGQDFVRDTNKNNHVEYQSTYAQQPVKTHEISYGTNVPNKENYIFHPPQQSNYNGPNVQAPYIGQSVVSSGHEPEKEVYKIYPAQPDYSKHNIQTPVKEPQINYGIKSNQNINGIYPPQLVHEERYVQGPISEQHVYQGHKPGKGFHSPQSAIGNPYGQKPFSEQLDTSGHKPMKNIFDYYPHPSTYDAPKGKNVNHKPMYYEYPKRPLDGYETPYQKNPYTSSSISGLPLNQLIDHRPIVNLDEKAFLKISPLDFRALKPAGDGNLHALRNLGLESPKHGEIPASQGFSPRYPALLQHTNPSIYPALQSYGAGIDENPTNGLDRPVNYKNRPLNPIETKSYRNPRNYLSQKGQLNIPTLNVNNIPPVLSTPLHSSTPFAYKVLNYPIKPVHIHKHLVTPVIIKNAVPNQVQKHLGLPLYKSPVVQTYYPKTPVPTPIFRYQGRTRPLIHLPPLRTMPQILSNPYPKVHNFYKSPHMHMRVPASGITHVPIATSQQYPINNEHLYHTASTPQSTHILDTGNIHNGSFYSPEKKYLFGYENRTKPSVDYSTAPVRSHDRVPTSGIDENRVDVKLRDVDTYIFVSGTGNQDNPDAKKQFFHAYYAPGDHEAPPGYVRMTIQEFNNLFKNAEIRYVDKEPTNSLS